VCDPADSGDWPSPYPALRHTAPALHIANSTGQNSQLSLWGFLWCVEVSLPAFWGVKSFLWIVKV